MSVSRMSSSTPPLRSIVRREPSLATLQVIRTRSRPSFFAYGRMPARANAARPRRRAEGRTP